MEVNTGNSPRTGTLTIANQTFTVTQAAASVKALDPKYRLVLTGTPMENRLGELASIMEWVDEQALEPKWRLAPLHSLSDSGPDCVISSRLRLGPTAKP